MNKVIVTGAGGFIGSHLVKNLLDKGIDVIGIDISSSTLEKFKTYKNFKFIKASFEDYNKLNDLIKDKDIDVFYHFAWSGVFGESFKNYELQLNNVKYACDALMASIKLGCKKFVFAGTINEFEIKKYMNQDIFEPRFTCLYASCKMNAEMICKTLSYNYGIDYNAGLIAMAYGEGNKSNMLANVVMKDFINGIKPTLIEGKNLYDMIYVKDIAEAFYEIGMNGKNMKSYYVGHRKVKIFREWINEIRDILAPDMKLTYGEYKDTLDMDYGLIDTEALYNDTGFECKHDFKESIKKTAIWLGKH